jgi:hypothetical protein
MKQQTTFKFDIKVRRTWGDMDPNTRRIESKKSYNRKQKFKKDLSDFN